MGKRSNIEKHNDSLLFWSILGPYIYYIVGVIVVVGILIAGFSIKGAIDRHTEQVATKQEQDLTVKRQEIVNGYIANNSKTFGTVSKQWNTGNLFFIKSDKGEFTVAFEGAEVSKIYLENRAGQMITLYEKANRP